MTFRDHLRELGSLPIAVGAFSGGLPFFALELELRQRKSLGGTMMDDIMRDTPFYFTL